MAKYIDLHLVGDLVDAHWNVHYEDLLGIPAADVVSRGAYEQAAWERDVALEQLRGIGKSLGERMDDVAIKKPKKKYIAGMYGGGITSMSKPKLFMMCGVSGSGKTTFAKRFAEDCRLRYINPDNFYALYNGDEREHKHEFEIWMALFRALHMAEQDGIDVMFDTNAPTVVDRTQILDWFPGFEHHLICVMAPPEICVKNNKARNRVVPDDVMAQMFDCIQIPTKDESRWQSITWLQNNHNNGFELARRFNNSETIPVTRIHIAHINDEIRAEKE